MEELPHRQFFETTLMLGLKKRKSNQAAVGCGYLLLIGTATGILLVINIFLVGAFFHINRSWLLGFYPDKEVQFRISQAAQIFLPVIMTMIQFWIYDRFIDRAFGYGTKEKTVDRQE